MLKVERKPAEQMFKGLGYNGVEKWSDQRMQDKLEGLADLVEEEGDELPELKGKDKKLFDSILKAIEDEEEINLGGAEPEDEEDDEDEDVQDVEDEDDEEDDDEDEDDDSPAPADSDDDEEDDEDDEEEPEPVRGRVEAKEEFVGMKDLIAAMCACTEQLSRLAAAVEAKLAGVSHATAAAPSQNGKASISDVVKAIRTEFSKATSESTALKPEEVAATLAKDLHGWKPSSLKKRIVAQLTKRMPKDGIVVKKAKSGKFWVKK